MTDWYILQAEQFRAADGYAVSEMGLSVPELMERAADGLYKGCVDLCGESLKKIPVTFLCGKGNNGGDGFCLCARLAEEGYDVAAIAVFGTGELSGAAAEMASRVPENCLINLVCETGESMAYQRIACSGLVVDCVFGTGFSGVLSEEIQRLFAAVQGKKILACDLPSGVSCDGGQVSPGALKADKTITFAAWKPACFLYPGKDFFGETEVWDIGITRAVEKNGGAFRLITADLVRPLLKVRPENSHKGTFGGVQLCCGSKWMSGAAGLAARAALKSGVGLVYLSCGKKLRRILQTSVLEAVYTKPKGKTKAGAFVVGCGLGKKARYLKSYWKRKKPMVVDGDALNYLANHPKLLKKSPSSTVLTPHPLEMARLLGIPVSAVESDRIGIARYAAERFSSVVVLKGRHTVIASPGGSVWINRGGNSALAKGGSGDVLAGFLGGLLASGYSAEEASVIAVYAHSRAAEILPAGRPEEGVLPSEIISLLDNAFFLRQNL